MTQSKSNKNSNNNHIEEDYYPVVITTTTDLEEGIEIPLPLEEGVELPLAVFEGIDNDNNELFGNQTKLRGGALTPTTVTSTSSFEEEDDGFVHDSGKHTTTTWSSWKSSRIKVGAIILIVTTTIIIFSYTTYHLVTSKNNSPNNIGDYSNIHDNYGNNVPLVKCQDDCDTSGGNNGGSSNNIDGGGGREKQQSEENIIETTTATSSINNPMINSSSSSTTSTTEVQPPPTPPPTPPPRDRFLLSGQSNMIGHTTSYASITGDNVYWRKLKSILDSASSSSSSSAATAIEGGNTISTRSSNGTTTTAGSSNGTTMEQELYNLIYQANNRTNDHNHSTIDQVATTLTHGVMELYQSSLLNDLDTPLQYGKCSFVDVNDDGVENVSGGTVPISSMSKCGRLFGHELLFGRTMELDSTMNYYNYSSSSRSEFELVKIARGGSGLYEHWYPNHGLHWDLLKDAIEEKRQDGGIDGGGDWKGFIWHQGSQAAFSELQYGEDRSYTYHGNLTVLVNEVRELMFQNSMTWRCKEEIPVVIVQVGYWPGTKVAAQRTRDAQAKFCNQDPRAVLVKTDDLARFFHFDAASFLISGNRIAHAYQEALEGVVECPMTEERVVPSCSPSLTLSMTMEPSQSLEPTVLRLETDLHTDELV